MDLQHLLPYIGGPTAALILTLAAIGALALGKFVVPRWVFDSTEKRCDLLENENTKLNETVVELVGQNSALREELAGIKVEVRLLRDRLTRGGL